jgi:hypothetical protein
MKRHHYRWLTIGLVVCGRIGALEPKEAKPPEKCRITLTDGDFQQMDKAIAGSEDTQWETDIGHVIRCRAGGCRVSCDAPPKLQSLQRWDSFRAVNIRNYLSVLQKARQQGHSQKDALGVAECEAHSCTLTHD